MTGQFDATRPVSRHHPPAESSTAIWVASSTAEWATYGRNWNHVSNSVGLSTLGLFTGQRDPKERAVKPGSDAGHLHRLDLSAAPPTGCCSAGKWRPCRHDLSAAAATLTQQFVELSENECVKLRIRRRDGP